MPRYYKNGGKSGYKKRFKALTHDTAAKVLGNLSPSEFSRIRELARHGLGDYTMFAKLLPKHPKTKVKPSSFQFIANAQTPHEVIAGLHQEKRDHDDPTSETHFGGGLRDAVNSMGRWAYSLLTLPNMVWAYNKLDSDKTATENAQTIAMDALEDKVSDEWIEDILETHVGQHDPESTVIQKGNAVMDGVNWIGSILGSTANFLSDFDAPNETFSTDYRN